MTTQTLLRVLPLPAGTTLRLYLAPFTTAAFSNTAFGDARLRCPPHIARSVPKRQAEFFFGRLAAQAALDDIGSNDTEVRVGSHREPIWPTGVVGSISHVEGLAGAVVADSAHFDGVGIDLERIALGDAQVALREVALDATELALLTEARGTLTLDECVTIAFSAKESLYKACYPTVQRLFGFDAVRVQSMDTMDTTRGTITLMILDHLHTRFTRGRLFEIAFFRLYPDLFFTVLQIAAPDAAPPESHLHLPG